MERIPSFTIDHTKLNEGLYVSRTDHFGDEFFTTFDLRMKKPNTNDVLSTGSAHAIEHLGATYLRNDEIYKDKTVYFGPMGCRTGFYAIFHGSYSSEQIADLIRELFRFIVDFDDTIPGASEVECGNYRDMDLKKAKEEAQNYLDILEHLDETNTIYPNK